MNFPDDTLIAIVMFFTGGSIATSIVLMLNQSKEISKPADMFFIGAMVGCLFTLAVTSFVIG